MSLESDVADKTKEPVQLLLMTLLKVKSQSYLTCDVIDGEGENSCCFLNLMTFSELEISRQFA